MLLDPFEKELYLPSLLVEVGNGLCRYGEVVGQEIESLVDLLVVVFDPS